MDSMQRCKICGSNDIKYICRTCSSVYCERCVIKETKPFFVCTKCNSSNIVKSIHNGNFVLVCRDCGSSNISQAIRHIKKCPHCRTQIESIDDLWNKIHKTYTDILKSFQEKTYRLYELIDNLVTLRNKLILIREKGFIHDMGLDEDMVDLFVKVNTRLHDLTKMINALTEYNLLLPSSKSYFMQYPLELLRSEQDVLQLHELLNNISVAIDNVSDSLISNTNSIVKRFQDIEFHLNYFDKYSSYINLESDELPICAIPDIKLLKSVNDMKSKTNGTILLTFKRLIFIEEHNGKTLVPLNIKLDELGIENTKIIGLIAKRLQIPSKYGLIEIGGDLSILEIIKNYLETARNLMHTVKKPYLDDLYKQTINIQKFRKAVNDAMKELRRKKVIPRYPREIASEPQRITESVPATTQDAVAIEDLFKGNNIQFVNENISIQSEEQKQTQRESIEDKILELESERYGIQKSLELLDNQWKARMISQMDYINEYNRLQAKLYKINKMLEKYVKQLN